MPISGGGGTVRPTTGWPRTDLAQDVQNDLDKAAGAIQLTSRGAANGVPSTDGAGRVPLSQLPLEVLTEDAYQALVTKDPNVIYFRTP